MLRMQGDELPDYPEDADIPGGEEGIQWVLKAAEELKAKGNAAFKVVELLYS